MVDWAQLRGAPRAQNSKFSINVLSGPVMQWFEPNQVLIIHYCDVTNDHTKWHDAIQLVGGVTDMVCGGSVY